MNGGRTRDRESPPEITRSKFSVYQDPALSEALSAKSLRPPKIVIICLFFASLTSAYGVFYIFCREHGFIDKLKPWMFSSEAAYVFDKIIQLVVALFCGGTLIALIKAISLWRVEKYISRNLNKPPKSKPDLGLSPSDILFPLHPSAVISNWSFRMGTDKLSNRANNKTHSLSTPSKSPGSASSLYSAKASRSLDQLISTPWSNKRTSATKEIPTEEMLEEFLEEVGERVVESAEKLTTPPSAITGFGMASPSLISNSANSSGSTRSTHLRPVRISPSSQLFATPPKKREGEFPQPMSIEESIKAFEQLGVYPQIEQWGDRLRQWFSSVLLKPLCTKVENSHIQVMQSAAKFGVSITISQVGSDAATTVTPATESVLDRRNEWQPASTLNEEAVLHQMRASLERALLDASTQKLVPANWQQPPQQNPLVSTFIQECLDAINEHQRLLLLLKGEWAKGLLPQSSVCVDYTVQRIRELAEGMCVKKFEYLGSEEGYERMKKSVSLEVPSDSHLLLYLFCAFLEHPKWMLHVDPISHGGVQSSKNPLFLGALPPKERFPEKYVAIISSVPSYLHPGVLVLAIGRQSPPIFALYWDKKLQICLQGRSALWDSISVMCYWIKVKYGGIVHGMHLDSPPLSILSVLDSDYED